MNEKKIKITVEVIDGPVLTETHALPEDAYAGYGFDDLERITKIRNALMFGGLRRLIDDARLRKL